MTAPAIKRRDMVEVDSGLHVADWVDDVRFMISEMERIHPNLYEAHDRGEWYEAAGKLEEELQSSTLYEAVLGFMRLAALAPDGHTGVWSYPRGPYFDRRYPLIYDSFSDGLYVRSTIEKYKALFGKRIVAINGTPIEDALKAVSPFISAENDVGALVQRVEWLFSVPTCLSVPEVLHAAGLADELEYGAELTVSDVEGGESVVEISAAEGDPSLEWIDADQHFGTKAPKPLYRWAERKYSYVYLREHSTLYVNFQSVQNEDDEPLADFCRRLFEFVGSHDVQKFVLDIRNNQGGNLYLDQPLVHGLISSKRINRPGSLFVIIGRVTFSAAMHLAADIERNTHALFVGEPTGARPNFYSDVEKFRLPKSGIEILCSHLYWQNSDPRDMRQWILPDIPAQESYADFVAHRDPALEAVIEYDAGVEHLEERPPNRNWYRPSQKVELPFCP